GVVLREQSPDEHQVLPTFDERVERVILQLRDLIQDEALRKLVRVLQVRVLRIPEYDGGVRLVTQGPKAGGQVVHVPADFERSDENFHGSGEASSVGSVL